MLQHFVKKYIEKTKPIIKDTFYGIIRSIMKCNNCFKKIIHLKHLIS